MHPETTVVAAGRPARTPRAPLNESIVLSATFQSGPDDNYYLRQGSSDTIRAFEAAVGELDGGTALAFGSGMAAITAVVEGRPAGSVAVVPTSGYSGMTILFANQESLGRRTVRRAEITDTEAVIAALNESPGAGLLWLETTTNPMIGVTDLPRAHHGRPGRRCPGRRRRDVLDPAPRPSARTRRRHCHALGTKYLSGHSDLLMGVLVARDPAIVAQLRARRDITGGVPGALESYLALRGLRTLALRMERAQANALELAGR